MKPRKYRAKSIPTLLGIFNGEEKYTESEWVYGYYAPTYLFVVDGEDKNTYCIISDDTIERLELLGCGVQSGLPEAYNIIKDTLSQSIGLFDKNGKEIFEGDIFQEENYGTAVVIYDDGQYKLEWYGWYEHSLDGNAYGESFDKIETAPISNYEINQMEVIGNIWDNPDLIEEPKGEEYE